MNNIYMQTQSALDYVTWCLLIAPKVLPSQGRMLGLQGAELASFKIALIEALRVITHWQSQLVKVKAGLHENEACDQHASTN